MKNLIGKELITNEFVAIFELVKNSFDAHAKNVKIIFKDIYKANPSVTIYDDGKGMDLSDLRDKWLFVAYSAKRDGTEDDNESLDYRNRLKSKRGFAGAKGVGRFSCDRLAKNLKVITIKNKPNSKIESITVDWGKFENDQSKEFYEIGVIHDTLDSHQYSIVHGTILELTNLRDKWDRNKILKLKRSLEKLINPNEQDEEFAIELIVEEEKEADVLVSEEHSIVNGYINNTIFKILEIKTFNITSYIPPNGETIITTLNDRGRMIYELTEINNYPELKNIKIEIFYLNRPAKVNFTKVMGVEPVNYGSIFMFKNGFRVFPIGEVGDDSLGLDRRKTQGHSRYLGTREIIGRIDILGENENLKETTSRDGGLIKNDSTEMLNKFLKEKVLRRLEKYLTEVINWGGLLDKDGVITPEITPEDAKNEILEAIKKLSKAKEVIDIKYDMDFFEIIEERQNKSVSKEIKNLVQTASKITDNEELHKGIEKIGKRFNEIIEDRNQLEKEIDLKETELFEKESEIRNTQQELKLVSNQNLFLKSVSTLDFDNIVSLHHQIGIYSSDIEAQLVLWNRRLNNKRNLDLDSVKKLLDNINFLNKKIMSVVKFATKANFNLQSEKIEADLIAFIKEYILNVFEALDDNTINISVLNNTNESFIIKFKPIELSIILDNIISNAKKFKAKNIEITFDINENRILIIIKDDGLGLDKSIKDSNKIFEKGFSTTSGSGLGLFHTKQILLEMNSDISVLENNVSGMGVVIEVKK